MNLLPFPAHLFVLITALLIGCGPVVDAPDASPRPTSTPPPTTPMTTPMTAQCSRAEDCPNIVCRCGDGSPVNSRRCDNRQCAMGEQCAEVCRSFGHPAPGSSTGGAGGGSPNTTCVAGTSVWCSGSGLTWTGSLCCADSTYGQCVDGTATWCTGAGLQWTGARCCVDRAYRQCVAGTPTWCTGTELEWTGSRCCVTAAYSQCVDGTATWCTGTDLTWTGAACCLRSTRTCVPGTASGCRGKWTGSLCCL